MTPVVAPGQSRFEIGDIGVLPDVHPHLTSVNAGEPGARAGLKAGDVVVAVDGEPITFSSQLRAAIAKHPGKADSPLSILRGGSPQTIVVTPRKNGTVGYLGISPGRRHQEHQADRHSSARHERPARTSRWPG